MCVAVFRAGENVRCWEEGLHVAQEWEDIKGDFPPRLQYFKCTHLVFLRFPHKVRFVSTETAQEARSDMGTPVMVH